VPSKRTGDNIRRIIGHASFDSEDAVEILLNELSTI
jgi:hypothetical protein